jgi:adenylate cyclase
MSRRSRQASAHTSPRRRRGRTLLDDLLSERNQYPERAPEIDQKIKDAFQKKIAILVLDMVGFSRMSVEHGIIHYLGMIRQMHETATPPVLDNGGAVLKKAADNLFCRFDNPSRALEGALDIFRAFDAVDTALPDDRDLFGSIGIGYGNTLVIDDEDMFGTEMNLACKLGEDCAGKQEILVTPAAYAALTPDSYVFSPVSYLIGGMELGCFRFVRSVFPREK